MSGAAVFRGRDRAGTIRRTRSGATFEYDDAFVKRALAKDPDETGIAIHLPYAKRKIETHGVNVHTFFAGLLPEGLRLRALVRRVKTSEDDLLTLLVAAGADCVGDVSVVQEDGESETITPSIDIAHIDRVSFADVLKKTLATGDAAIPGVQEKVSAAMISVPLRSGRASSFILKLTPKTLPKLVENEHFFMTTAHACGIETARTELVRDRDDVPGLLVTRFDREGGASLHQEDTCQILDRYPADKYNVSTADLMRALDVCSAPILAHAALLKLVAFSYAIGNGDLHAKNVSVYAKDNTLQITPAYDLLSTIPYGDSHLALKVDAKDDGLTRAAFVTFGERHGVRRAAVHAMLDEIVEGVQSRARELEEIGWDARKTKHLRQVIAKRTTALGTESSRSHGF